MRYKAIYIHSFKDLLPRCYGDITVCLVHNKIKKSRTNKNKFQSIVSTRLTFFSVADEPISYFTSVVCNENILIKEQSISPGFLGISTRI